MRLIDAEKVEELLWEMCDENDFDDDYCSGVMDGLEKAIKTINEQPTIEPVKRGHWEDMGNGDIDGIYNCCSVCQEEAYFDYDAREYVYFDYCPHCGAKMDGESE